MAKPTIDLPPATIHHHKPTKPMFFTNQHTATNYQSKLSKANTSQLQTHPHLNPPQNLATHDHDPPKEGRHGYDLPSGTTAIHPVAWRNPSRHNDDPSAARRRSIQRHDGDPRCDGDPSSGGTMAILGVTTTHQWQDGNDLLREAREREAREAQWRSTMKIGEAESRWGREKKMRRKEEERREAGEREREKKKERKNVFLMEKERET